MGGVLNNVYNSTVFSLSIHTRALALLQEQVSTGSRINRASDSPSDAYRVLGLQSQKRSLGDQMDNIAEVVSTLEVSLSRVDSMFSTFSKSIEHLNQVISGTYDSSSREMMSDEINDALEEMVSLANTRYLDQYIFGGSNTSSPPYSTTIVNGKITGVEYQGGNIARNVEVAPGVESSPYYVGKDIFGSNSRSETIFSGDTGASKGTGTSNASGDRWLTVTGTAGNYDLSIDGGATTVHTDGTDTNLAVTTADGDVIYVDTTAITGAGTDHVRSPGTYDIFNSLIGIRDVLENSEGLSEDQLKGIRSSAMSSLDEVKQLLARSQVSIGSRIGFLSDIGDSLEDMKYNTEDETARIQEADIAQIVIDLSRREILYQMSLSVSAKMMSMSLLDFLR